MAAITSADVRTFVGERQTAGASNAEINRELSVLKRMYTLALEAGKLLHRPHIQMLQEHNVRTGFFEREQFEGGRRYLPEYLRGVMTFAYITQDAQRVRPLRHRQRGRLARGSDAASSGGAVTPTRSV